MDEHEFWQRLEFRICAEFAGLPDQRLRYYWCDGLIPEDYDLASAEPHISASRPPPKSTGQPSCPATGSPAG